MSASLIGRLGSSAFRLSTYSGVDVAHGLVLLFGIGTKALPSWVSRTRRNNFLGGLAVRSRQVQSYMRTPLIHRPARDIIPPLVELKCPPIGFNLAGSSYCCHGVFSGPTDLGAVDPDGVHDHGDAG